MILNFWRSVQQGGKQWVGPDIPVQEGSRLRPEAVSRRLWR